MKVLVIGAHLDDSVLAIGGIIRKLVNAGARVDEVCFGNSDEDFSTLEERDTAVERITAQAVRAHEIMGVTEFTCFNYSDFAVQENKETYRLCIESIRKYRPDIIFSHYWAEYFQHHAMAKLAVDSWWQAGWNVSADLGMPWLAKGLYHFEVLHALPEPTDIVDISDTFDAKMAAWACFQSSSEVVETGEDEEQRHYGAVMGSLTEQLECRARHYGSQIGLKYAEPLKRSFYLPRPIRDILELR